MAAVSKYLSSSHNAAWLEGERRVFIGNTKEDQVGNKLWNSIIQRRVVAVNVVAYVCTLSTMENEKVIHFLCSPFQSRTWRISSIDCASIIKFSPCWEPCVCCRWKPHILKLWKNIFYFLRFFWKVLRMDEKKIESTFSSFFIFPPPLLMIDYAFADSLCCHHFFSSSPALCWIHFNEHCWDLNSISSNLMSHLQRISPGFVSATFTLFTLHLRRCALLSPVFPSQFHYTRLIFAISFRCRVRDDGSNLHFFPSVYRCPHWKHQHLLLFASFEY